MWRYKIGIAVISETDPNGIYEAYDTVKIIDDETDDPQDIHEALDKIIDLGVCGKIELEMYEVDEPEDEDDDLNPTAIPMPVHPGHNMVLGAVTPTTVPPTPAPAPTVKEVKKDKEEEAKKDSKEVIKDEKKKK